MILSFLVLTAVFSSCFTQSSATPSKVSSAVIAEERAGQCPSQDILDASKEALKEDIDDILQDFLPVSTCPCGGAGLWRRIAHLNMTDPTQQCPPNWNPYTSPVRGCGWVSRGCVSASYPSHGQAYSRVCGRILAYQSGTPNGFELPFDIERAYFEGISLTHGAAGSRQHIWSFVAAYHEGTSDCSCLGNGKPSIPSIVGDDYFCATATSRAPSTGVIYQDNPLWDGEGCGLTNACCEFNNPPWFCTTLPQVTTDDIEIRNCADFIISNEDTLVNIIDIYIM